MIKIIKDGTKEIVNCEKCGCTFSYEKEDVKVSYNSCFGHDLKKEYVICPQCGKEYVIIQER